jgi:high-affinity nickel-transport protein
LEIGPSGTAGPDGSPKKDPGPADALLPRILVLNAAAWLFFLWESHAAATFIGMGILAYVLGIRHGFDADHIAVIDNVVRKLQSRGKSAGFAGFSFAIGHSAVVVVSNLALILFFPPFAKLFHGVEAWGSRAGNLLSAGFLSFIGLVNVLLVFDILKTYRAACRTGSPATGRLGEGSESAIATRPFVAVPDSRAGMVSLGFLFGLSFDTSAEIALLVASLLSVPAGSHSVLSLTGIPLLFAAGMITVDTLDGLIMSRAYRWAMEDIPRTCLYNLILTGLSVFTAWGVGGLEWVQIIGTSPAVKTLSWNGIGEGIVLVFLVAWGIMVAGNRLRSWWMAIP